MSGAGTLRIPVEIDAPARQVWDAVVDWPAQGRWILATRVRATRGTGRAVGDRVTAVTGFGRLAVADEFEITEWDPPRRCVVRHLGRVVRGTGTFEVVPESPARSRFIWSEDLELPLGRLGRAGWPLARPVFAAGVSRSLQRFADLVAAGRIGVPAGGDAAAGGGLSRGISDPASAGG